MGVIDALMEAGIEPDIVCGTSMGSFVGAANENGDVFNQIGRGMAAGRCRLKFRSRSSLRA